MTRPRQPWPLLSRERFFAFQVRPIRPDSILQDDDYRTCLFCTGDMIDGDPHDPIQLPCGHVFGRECLMLWLNRPSEEEWFFDRCPRCQQVLHRRTCACTECLGKIPQPRSRLQAFADRYLGFVKYHIECAFYHAVVFTHKRRKVITGIDRFVLVVLGFGLLNTIWRMLAAPLEEGLSSLTDLIENWFLINGRIMFVSLYIVMRTACVFLPLDGLPRFVGTLVVGAYCISIVRATHDIFTGIGFLRISAGKYYLYIDARVGFLKTLNRQEANDMVSDLCVLNLSSMLFMGLMTIICEWLAEYYDSMAWKILVNWGVLNKADPLR